MTKKDYIAIAKIINKSKEHLGDSYSLIRYITVELIDLFKMDNKNFDEDKFWKAVDMVDGEEK